MNLDDARAIVDALCSDLIDLQIDAYTRQQLTRELAAHDDCSRVIQTLTDSDAHLEDLIRAAHRQVLGTEPSDTEISTTASAIRAGSINRDDLELHVLQRVADRWTRSSASFTALVYDVAFGRVLTVAEADHWDDRLGDRTLAAIAAEIWSSPERGIVRVRHLYRTHLFREPDPEGLRVMLSLLLQHGDNAVRSALVASDEYRALARNRLPVPITHPARASSPGG